MLRLAGIVTGQGPDADVDAIRRVRRSRCGAARDRHRGLAGGGDGAGRRRRGARRPPRPRARPRPDAALRPLRRRASTGRPGRGEPGLSLDAARGASARDRPRPAAAAAPRGAADPEREDRALPGADPRRPGPARGSLQRRAERLRPDRPPRICARTTPGCTTSPTWSAASRRCTMHVSPADAERLGLIDGGRGRGRVAGGLARRPGRGDRRDHGRRRLDPARLGPRRGRSADGRRRAPTPGSTRTCSPTSTCSTRSRATPFSTASRSRSPLPEPSARVARQSSAR